MAYIKLEMYLKGLNVAQMELDWDSFGAYTELKKGFIVGIKWGY
jgi:hypothetical protein